MIPSKNYIMTGLACLTIILVHCDNQLMTPENNMIIVKAFLYAHELVQDIQVLSTTELDASKFQSHPVNDAHVYLYRNGTEYALISSDKKNGYYHYPGNDLDVSENDTFRIEVGYYGRTASGTTVIPDSLHNFRVLTTTIYTDSANLGTYLFTGNYKMAEWSGNNGSHLFVSITNIETDSLKKQLLFPANMVTFPLFVQLFSQEFMLLPNQHLKYAGRHTLYIANVHGMDMTMSYGNYLVFPYANHSIWNFDSGIGIIAGFNSREFEFNVVTIR